MPLFSDEAITLRHYDFGEADRIVSFFGRRFGKVRIVAKGCRKLKSRFAGRLEPFHTVDIVYFGRENANLFKLSSVDMKEMRPGAGDNLERYARACYLAELLEAGLREGDPNPKAWAAAEAALGLVMRETRPAELDWIVRFFEVKFMALLGYTPTLDRCVACRGPLDAGAQMLFDAEKGGLTCQRCKHRSGGLIPLSAGAAKFLGKILTTGFAEAARLKPSPALLAEIARCIGAFRAQRLTAKINSEKFFTPANIG